MIDTAAVRQIALRNFTDLDTDGDGLLTRADYLALAERRLSAVGSSADAPQGQAVLEAFGRAWQAHADSMDANDDGQITQAEYLSSFETLVRTDNIDAILTPMFRATFDLADRDSDGALAVEEFQALWTKPDADLTAEFAQADTDNDSLISFEEYAAVRRRLLLGEVLG